MRIYFTWASYELLIHCGFAGYKNRRVLYISGSVAINVTQYYLIMTFTSDLIV